MKIIPFDELVRAVENLVMETNYHLPRDVYNALVLARSRETSSRACTILDQIIANAEIASAERLPICQDTGVAVFFADIGEDVRVDCGGFNAAVQEGTRRGYLQGGLRMSMVNDPLQRDNTGDNTPAIIHTSLVRGENITLRFCPKGGGCENMSRLAMLTPGEGSEGVIDFIRETIRIGGGRPCPPLIVGVGLGGTFESCAIAAKRALFRTLGSRNKQPHLAELEVALVERINELGIGPMGLGGQTTVLDVFVEAAPCHIASLPVAVNIQCHAARHGEIVIA